MKNALLVFGGASALSLFTGSVTDIVLFGCATTYALFTRAGKDKTP